MRNILIFPVFATLLIGILAQDPTDSDSAATTSNETKHDIPEPKKPTLELIDNVYNITIDNHEEFIKLVKDRKVPAMIKIFATWCAHCRDLAPIYKEAARLSKEDPDLDMIFGEIDGDANDKLANEYSLEYYPSLYMLTPNYNYTPTEYNGEKLADSILYSLKHYAQLPSFHLEDIDSYLSRSKYLNESYAFGIFKGKDSDLFKQFNKLRFRNARAYHSFNMEAFTKHFGFEDIKERVLIVKNKYFLREGEAKYYEWDESKKMKIGAFARSKFINSIEFCDYRTMTTFSKSAKPLAILINPMNWTHYPESIKVYADQLLEIGAGYEDKLNFCLYKEMNLRMLDQRFIPRGNESVTFFIFERGADPIRYRLSGDLQLDNQTYKLDILKARSFIESYFLKEVPIYYKSIPIPTLQEFKVLEIVAINFDSIVNDPKKNVVVRLYHRWYENYDERGNYFNTSEKLAHVPDLLFTELEKQENDIQRVYRNPPDPGAKLVFLATKSRKIVPYQFKGEMEKEGEFEKWILDTLELEKKAEEKTESIGEKKSENGDDGYKKIDL